MAGEQTGTIIVVGHEKGGVGKSAIASSFAAKVAADGADVIVVDADPQSTSANWQSLRDSGGVEPRIMVVQDTRNMRNNVVDLARRHSVVIVDVGANDYETLGDMATIVDLWLAPTKVGQSDCTSTYRLVQAFEAINNRHKRGEIPIGILVNMAPGPWNNSEPKDTQDFLRENCPKVRVFDTIIKDRRSWRDAGRLGKGITEMNDQKASEEFTAFYNEALGFMQEKAKGNK